MPTAETTTLFGDTVLNRWNIRRIEECRTLIDWLAPAPDERILDVGCGDGYNTAAIARRGAIVTGIDVNEYRLAIARKRHRGLPVDFQTMNAETMSFPDASFDKAISFCVIEHFERDDLVLANVRRVLEPHGTLVLSADSLMNPEIRAVERQIHSGRYDVKTFYSVDVLRKKLEEAGFVLDRWRYILTTPVTLTLVRASWRLDDLPLPLLPVKAAGYLVLRVFGKPLSDVTEWIARRPDSGLTLLATASVR
jgi:2-polyprenyl-3-methyl-5-hydroxy-6-metoxy-1,4-benzoquinol methylase